RPDSLEFWIKTMLDGIYASWQRSNGDRHLYQQGIKNYTYGAYQLYQTLIEPVYGEKRFPKKLVIVPDGILGYIPFDILLSELPSKSGNFQNYAFMIKNTEISYAYSVKLHLEMAGKEIQASKNQILAFAPSFPPPPKDVIDIASLRNGYYSLFNNQQEVTHLGKSYSSKVFKAEKATKENFTASASQYNIIHLATHAKVDDQNPDYSHIAFYPDHSSQKEQLLTISEIYNLDLNTSLAVLSACETGLGKLREGEGILSMARAFAYAGAKSVVYSLWSVDDQSTTEIMTGFYDHLGQGETKSEALRNAKLDYLHNNDMQHGHPFFWAAMVPVGDMSPLNIHSKNIKTFWFSSLLVGFLGILMASYYLGKGRQS
ncbi:MAG: CHAT domain-containing protein, partial [Bacteroidetes bacterium]|nr:CHAT domain-containing protein [Bacteroidota bacterium]